MKFNKYFLLFVFISICSLLNSVIWEIKQDGTGNFTTIQEGIITATDSDTILVYPGTYFENIDYLEKSLTVASLYILTPEDSLINQTIIDGNQQFRCVTIDDCEEATILGFTIQNGLAYGGNTQSQYGGGVYLRNTSNAVISNCRIKDNKAYSGGGLHINHGNTILEKNTISNNWGVRFGGGISVYGNDTILQFSEFNLNNIYLNYSSTGSDISITEVVPPMDIYVDTLTVSEPDYFFINPSHKYTFYGLHSKFEQIDQDLYVAPDGNNNNSGLTENDPLQTIAWAQTLIKRNDENPNTIHIDSGIYSPSMNNQKYPLNIKHGVKYIGISFNETILDAEGQTPFIRFFSFENLYPSVNFQNLTLINGYQLSVSSAGAIDIYYQADIILKNVKIDNCFGWIGSAIQANDGYYDFDNVVIQNNFGGDAISLVANYQNQNPVLDVKIINSLIQNNTPGIEEGSGGGISLHGHTNIVGEYYAKLINCEISSNHDNFYNSQTGLGGSSSITVDRNLITDLVNCTIGNNSLSYSTGCVISVIENSELNIYNSIMYNNDGYSFNLWENAVVNITNSLIEGGDDNVNYYYPLAIVNWLDGNLDENPMFDSLGIYPFALLENSSCINAGTLDLPAGIELPEFDLAGNPRIVNGMVDMGAYEYQDSVSVLEDIITPITQTQLSNYPNPFNPSTTIKLDLAESGKIELAIYNIKGQKVKTLLNAYSTKGHFEIFWNGVDNNNNKLASGQYFIKLNVNGKEKAVSKCVLLK
ncbi:MAG: choice-of-anchor Q domain-containing protein [Candidatus Cloacimonadota bacterium]|nr:choice-of-anchor Q domain-containing protein [Candidatus Cloacimonadota bacterium]